MLEHMTTTTQVLDLSHDLHSGMHTHPGLPAPEWEPYKTRQEYQEASGTTFQIDRICMVGNTGTYLDSPYHRYVDGGDLASIPLSQVVNIPVVVVDARAHRAVGLDTLTDALGEEDITDTAVLLHTGGDTHWGKESYALDAPYVTAGAADWLAQRRPALVGIDSVNIDDLADLSRPVHTRLLADNILILEHLTGLGAVPARSARLHAAPLAWHGVGTWPVRAYATITT
jgi:kynurenine formamidase